MLSSYITLTQNLLQLPGAPTSLYSTANITLWVNIARGQLAGESQSIRRRFSFTVLPGTSEYSFATIGGTLPSGISGIIHVRRLAFQVGQQASGVPAYQWFRPRPWEWFELYHAGNPGELQPGPPQVWAQYQQGSSGGGAITGVGTGTMPSGSLQIAPVPDGVYTVQADTVCYPAALAADTDPEVLPYLWTDAVPFYAAYYALLSAQTSARMADAERYLGYYTQFVARARRAATPDVLPFIWEQSTDPTMANQLGMGGRGAGGVAA